MRHWTNETDAEASSFFATLTEREVRRRQDLCAAQIAVAHDRGLTDALEDLHRMEAALQRSLLERPGR